MKKTIIAMAVAGVVAAPIASADVSVSGKVETTFTSTESQTVEDDELTAGQDAKLSFSASEDLGNGMTAFAKIVIDTDDMVADTTNTDDIQDQKVGISGGFGTFVVGRMEDFSESKVLSMVDVFGSGGVELGGDNAQRQNGGIAYVSPTFSGVTLGAASYVLNDAAGSTIDDIDATDLAIMYANGPLAVNIAREEFQSNSATDNEEIWSVGAKYTAGDLSVSAVYQDLENAANVNTSDHEDVMVAAVYNMGNNSVAVGWNENELLDGSTDNNVTALEFRHKFSSRTRGYAGLTADSNADTTSETDTVYFGLEHSF